MKLLRICRSRLGENEWLLEISSSLVGDNLWLEIERYKGWLELSVKEIYDVAPEHQAILGSTDSRTVIELGFRLP